MQNPVLVIGASGTIGSAVATKLVKYGSSIIVHGGSESPRLKKLADKLAVPAIFGDLSKEDIVLKCTDQIQALSPRLSGLVFAAATPFPHKLTLRTDWEVFQQQMDCQLKSFHLVMQHLKNLLESSEDGARVVVLSTEYVLGSPPIKIAPYLAAKAALTTYAKILSQELLASNIRIQILAPGLIKSALTADIPDEYLQQIAENMPEKRLTDPEEVAHLCAFMMRPEADPLYGTTIQVSRGPRR